MLNTFVVVLSLVCVFLVVEFVSFECAFCQRKRTGLPAIKTIVFWLYTVMSG